MSAQPNCNVPAQLQSVSSAVICQLSCNMSAQLRYVSSAQRSQLKCALSAQLPLVQVSCQLSCNLSPHQSAPPSNCSVVMELCCDENKNELLQGMKPRAGSRTAASLALSSCSSLLLAASVVDFSIEHSYSCSARKSDIAQSLQMRSSEK